MHGPDPRQHRRKEMKDKVCIVRLKIDFSHFSIFYCEWGKTNWNIMKYTQFKKKNWKMYIEITVENSLAHFTFEASLFFFWTPCAERIYILVYIHGAFGVIRNAIQSALDSFDEIPILPCFENECMPELRRWSAYRLYLELIECMRSMCLILIHICIREPFTFSKPFYLIKMMYRNENRWWMVKCTVQWIIVR